VAGSGSVKYLPPWNADLMSAGYLLSLLPTLALLVGGAAALWRVIRRPSAEWVILLSLAALTGAALVYLTLKLPFFGQSKAFYAMTAAVPLVAVGAWGFDLVAGRRRAVRAVLWVLLLVWAANSYASVWIRSWWVETHVSCGLRQQNRDEMAEAAERFRRALRIDPDHVGARNGLAMTMRLMGRTDAALAECERVLAGHPDDVDAVFLKARLNLEMNRLEEAVALNRRATALAPDNAFIHQFLPDMLSELGRDDEAAAALRSQLRFMPAHGDLHRRLGITYAWLANYGGARRHFELARRFSPRDDRADRLLAWLLATCPDDGIRDGAEAVALAKALQRSWRPGPQQQDGRLLARYAAALRVLGAAYAEAGRFGEAADAARALLTLLERAGQAALAAEAREMLSAYRARRPWRDDNWKPAAARPPTTGRTP
jgi:tetratricopeptide (TPR) repeat protein